MTFAPDTPFQDSDFVVPPSDVSDGEAADTFPKDSPPMSRESWEAIRDDDDIQFAEVEVPEVPPREPSWFERALQDMFEWLADLFAPIGTALGNAWPVLQLVLLALLIGFILYLLARLYGPLGRNKKAAQEAEEVPEWQPDRKESLALLEDADRLAAEGRFDEATHLLLKRSVGQIASARPDWVEPSSTARELAALPALPDAARSAFRTVSELVERSLFALRSLERTDWEAARAAYAEFALAKIDGRNVRKGAA